MFLKKFFKKNILSVFILSLLSVLSIFYLSSFFSAHTYAADGHLPSVYKDFTNNLKEIPKPIEGDGAIDMTQKLIKEKIVPLAKFIFIGVGLIFLGMYAYQVTLGMGEDDQISSGKDNIMYAAMGFALVALAEPMTKIFDPIGAEDVTHILQKSAFESVTMLIINSLEVLLGTILVILIFYAGMQMVTADGDDKTMEDAKNTFKYSFIGILIIMIAKPLVTQVFYPQLGTVDIGKTQVENFMAEAFGILEYLLQFLGILVFVSFVYASVQYLMSGSDDGARESAKNILLWSVIGMVIILFAYAIVMFVVPSS